MKKIVIDPGHGGRDPGAVGPGGAMEKTIVLSIAQRMQIMIVANRKQAAAIIADISRVERGRGNPDTVRFFEVHFGGLENYLNFQRSRLAELAYTDHEYFFTRLDDRFITLRDRVEFARKKGADVFVSLHCNGFHDRVVHGVETFFHGTAQRRNIEGRKLATSIQSHIIAATKWRDRGIKQNSSFTVLRGTNALIPAVLVEFNFITNPVFEQQLNSFFTQTKLSRYTMMAIDNYIRGCE